MGKYLVRRLLGIIPVSLGISVIVFAMIHLVPGDPAEALVGPMRTPETLAEVRETLGLTAPLPVQYARWLGKVVRGDFGVSIHLKRPVFPELVARFRASILLAGASFILAVPIAITAGVAAAIRRGSLLDKLLMMSTMVGISMPPFYLGMLLIVAFSVKLQLLPSGGMFPVTGDATLASVTTHLILPAVALAGAPLTVVARMMRMSVLEVLGQDYIRTASSKGLKYNYVIWRHAWRNAIIPVIGLLALQVGYLLSATALVEVVFSWPGIGSLIVESILTRDLPVTQASVFSIAVVYVVINTIADALQMLMDPRIKYS